MHFIDKLDTPAEQFADDSRAGASAAKSEILLSQELFHHISQSAALAAL